MLYKFQELPVNKYHRGYLEGAKVHKKVKLANFHFPSYRAVRGNITVQQEPRQ
jgi:hypothetical protein